MGAYYHRCFRKGHPQLIHLVNTNDDTTAQQHGWNLDTIAATTGSSYPTGMSLEPMTKTSAIGELNTDSLLAKIAQPPYKKNPIPYNNAFRPSSSASSMSGSKRKGSDGLANENDEENFRAEAQSDNTSAAVRDVREFPQIMRDISKAKRLESMTSRKKNRSNSQNLFENYANAVFPPNINTNAMTMNQSQVTSHWDSDFSSSTMEPIPYFSQQFQASNLMNTDTNMNMNIDTTSEMMTILQSQQGQEHQHLPQSFSQEQGFQLGRLTDQPHQLQSPHQPNDDYFMQRQDQESFPDSSQWKQEFSNISSNSIFNNPSQTSSSFSLSSELYNMMSQQQQLQQQFEQFQQLHQPQSSVMDSRDHYIYNANNGDSNGSTNNNQDGTDQSFSVFARSA